MEILEMNNDQLNRRIKFSENQFEVHKMFALYWHAIATTGVAKLSNQQQGRKPTEKEKEQGIVIGWRTLSDDEKAESALDKMKSHIHIMNDIHEGLDELRSQLKF